MIGRTVTHYRIIGKLGSGGMGTVYKAEDLSLNRLVALKFLSAELTQDEEARQRFIAEAQAASSIEHPNICTIHETGVSSDGQSFISMAYYGGDSLKGRIERGPLGVAEAIRIAVEAAQGLAKAHATGIVHRDIKPGNIMLTDEGRVKIVDFGLARLSGQRRKTRTGATAGTIAYMSPEQARGETVDGRTDIWSLGVVLHEMLVGELPFKGGHEQAMVYSILRTEPRRICDARRDVPREVERIVERALEKRPARRFPSMSHLAAALQDVEQRMASGELRRHPFPFRLRRRHARIVGFVAAAAILIAAGGAILSSRLRAAARAPVAIALLPIKNLGGDSTEDWLSEGITDALYTDLIRIRSFKVAPMGSARKLAAADSPLRTIAKELHVTWVVEGSALRDTRTDRITISVSLSNVASGETTWADNFPTDLGGVLAVQDEITRAVAAEVKVQVGGEAQKAQALPAAPAANEAFQRGIFAAAKMTTKELQLSIAHLKKAIELEPGFARSYAELAGVYELAGSDAVGILAPTDSAEMAVAAARRALGLDRRLVAAHRVLGQVKRDYEWDFAGADTELDAALADSPDDPATLREQAWLRLLQDRGTEALATALRAQRLDPLDMNTATMVSVIYGILGKPAKGLEELGKVLDFSPSYVPALVTRGSLLAGTGAWSEAVSSFEKALSVEPADPDLRAKLAFAYAKAGRESDARKVAAELATAAPGVSYVSSAALALAAVGFGETEASLQLLEKAARERSRAILTLRFLPEWSALRSDPRFVRLVEEAAEKKR